MAGKFRFSVCTAAGAYLVVALAGSAGAQRLLLPGAAESVVSSPQISGSAPVTTSSGASSSIASNEQQSSLTVQQIVARQEDHFASIKNAQGTVVHSEIRYNEQGQPQAPVTQFIFFAYEGQRSVTLTMPASAAQLYKQSQGQVPWSQIISAYHVTGDTVYTINKPKGSSTAPTVTAIPYNPAVHENNPLVAFHPRQISDEAIPLRELARAIPKMQQRPTVTDITYNGKPMVRIDFQNPKVPGERLYYIIDPARGYLPVEIARVTGTQPVSMSRIIIGNTPDGTWIPAKRERVMYDAKGKQISRQTWEYEYLVVNKGLAPKALSLMYFNLPLTTKVEIVSGKPQGANSGKAGNPAASGAKTPPAAPPRVTSTPLVVPLR